MANFNLVDAWNSGIGPDIEAGFSAVTGAARNTAGWLSDRFNEMDPGAQAWTTAIGTFGAVFIGTSWLTHMTGFNGMLAKMGCFALAAGLAIAMSGEAPAEEAHTTPDVPTAGQTVTDPAGTHADQPAVIEDSTYRAPAQNTGMGLG